MRSGFSGESFKPIYDELEKHGNPPWAGVEANAGIPGSMVDWETYLAWHFNHGCVLVGVNMGATGEDLPRRLGESAFGDEAIAAYHKFLKGQPLVEKAVSMDRPEFRIQAKMKRVRAGIERWHASGKDPRPVGKLMEGAGPLASAGKLVELEKLVDRCLRCWAKARKCRTCIARSEGSFPGWLKEVPAHPALRSAPASTGSDSGLFHQERSTAFK